MKKCVTFLTIVVATLLTACSGSTHSAKEQEKDCTKFTTISRKDTCYLEDGDKESPKYLSCVSVNVAESDNKELETKINNTILYTIF